MLWSLSSRGALIFPFGPRHAAPAARLLGSVLVGCVGLGGCTAVVQQGDPPESDSASPTSCNQPDVSDEEQSSETNEDSGAASNDGPDAANPDSDAASSGDAAADGADASDSTGSTGGASNGADAEAGTVPGCGSLCGSVSELASEGNAHVEVGTEVEYGHNPPASGSHYPIWAKYGAYDEVVPRSYWVHNLEHGTVVLLYGPDATKEQQAELRAVYDALPDDAACGHKRALLTPDPELDDAIAVVSWGWVLEASCVDSDAILAFIDARRGSGIEEVCADGSFTP